jgi:cell fate regulator YaaT (PSP1 superfamily)
MDIEKELIELEQFEENEKEVKLKEKKDHKIEPDDCFYRVKFSFNNYSKICRTKNPDIKRGAFLIVPSQYGPEIGIVQGKIADTDDILSQDEILDMIRFANTEDRNRFSSNLKKSREAYEITTKKIVEHNLNMKLINVHYFLEDSKILFNFTADGRIDFRELVKDLASIFKTRIELRQIGVRDECRIIGGYGQCGKHFCCSHVISELDPITIKMAKEQNLTLNSLKISGTCGRLLCCLSYEFKTYLEEKKRFPDLGSKVKYENELFFVSEVNIQTNIVKLISRSDSEERYIYVNLNDLDYN